MRIVKEYEERKTQIVKVSEQLFLSKGYENCSVTDIVKAVGVAKGTFFYYFSTKEAVLDEIITRRSVQIDAACRFIAVKKEIPKEARFLLTVLQINTVVESTGETQIYHKGENALMHQKSMAAIVKILPPILKDIVSEDGIVLDNPEEKIMIIVSAVTVLLDEGSFAWDNEKKVKILQTIFQAASILLNLDEIKLLEEWKELCTTRENMSF